MRHIVIRNLGPLKDVDVFLNRLNVVLGPQSSGKSCLLKTASYCAWVEKRIQLMQDPSPFGIDNKFEKRFVEFHKLKGYTSDDTYLMYENDTMRFSYTWQTHEFEFEWKESRWDFVCPKVSYIPAERNMVAAIPNWFEVSMKNDNIRNFMTDWETARTSCDNLVPILNMGVSYKYDAASRKDKVVMDNGKELDFTNASSGLQSLIPLMVYVNFLYSKRFDVEKKQNIFRTMEENSLREKMYNEMTSEVANEKFSQYTGMLTNDIFLEEPEQNLFPPTQSLLVDYLKDMARGEHGGLLFVATHSPYVVTSFIEEREKNDVGLFLSQRIDDRYFKIYTATDKDVQTIYDYSIDVFHNIDNI